MLIFGHSIFYWINRIILGDTLFGISIWVVCVLSFGLASLATRWPRWLRWSYAIVLSFFMMVLAHYIVDALQILWVTPLGEPMHIQK